MDNYLIVGYGGHSYVAIDIIQSMGQKVIAYCDQDMKAYNPFKLEYFGKENEEKALVFIRNNPYFVAIGDNSIRKKVSELLVSEIEKWSQSIIHSSAIISPHAEINVGSMVSANASINPLSKIGRSVICNTSCVIEHECIIGDYAHIGPGAVLCGNVKVGEGSFVGANSVVKQGIKIGNNVTIGAGTVVIADVPDNMVVVGNPQRKI